MVPGRAPRPADAGTGPLTILHLVARSHRRGAELVALELAEELDALGHDNRVVALGTADGGGREPELPPLVDSAGMGPRDLLVRVRRVRRLLADGPVDVLVAHGGWAAQVAVLGAGRRRPRLVWQRIGSLPPSVWRPTRRWWWQAVARRFDAGVALTEDLAGELRRLRFRGPIWMIPNSRRPDRFVHLDADAEAAWLREELGVGRDTRVAVVVGHLDRAKRVDRALAVHARVLEHDPAARLVVVGSGPLGEELAAEVARRGIAGRVTFLGRRTDVERILAGSDVLLITSDVEGIPGVAIEAAMAGCPVVSVPVGGVAEVVADGVTGLVLADTDPDRMAAAVTALLADPARRHVMGEAARAGIERFSSTTTSRVYADALVDLVRGS